MAVRRITWNICAIFILFQAYGAHAKCPSRRLAFWPPTGVLLPANGRIVIEGEGDYRQQIAHLSQQRPILVGDGEEIALNVVGVHEGQFGITQAVLKPSKILRVGKSYEIRLATPASKDAVDLRVWMGSDRAPPSWTIKENDVTSPRWMRVPEAAGGEVVQFGCGPSIEAFVRVAADDDEQALQFLVELSRIDGIGRLGSYLLPATDNKISIGHGMCSGPFKLEAGVRYSVRLTAIDLAGNYSQAPGQVLTIVGPQ